MWKMITFLTGLFGILVACIAGMMKFMKGGKNDLHGKDDPSPKASEIAKAVAEEEKKVADKIRNESNEELAAHFNRNAAEREKKEGTP